jgi:peptidyl-tRNA hydrolase, PTH1 family
MWIFAGLGNPGAQYARNRHNIGFMALDALATRWRAPPWRSRFQGLATEAVAGPEKILLLKPQTFMNLSGGSIAEAARFYKVEPARVVVFHDELDLPPAVIRAKLGGGNAGHNGLRSATACIGNDYVRVRFGIGHPGDKALVHAWVLNDFAKAEAPWVNDAICSVAENADAILAGDLAGFQNKVNMAMAAAGHVEARPKPGDQVTR